MAAGAWELERTEQLRELEDFHLRAQVWERELASSREFFGQPNENDRRSVVGKLIPELGSHLAARGTSTFSPALDVVRRAWTLARNEVIPMKIAEVRADADRVAQEIALDPDFQAAARRADRERVIRRHLERDYGLRDPGLVQIIERAAH